MTHFQCEGEEIGVGGRLPLRLAACRAGPAPSSSAAKRWWWNADVVITKFGPPNFPSAAHIASVPIRYDGLVSLTPGTKIGSVVIEREIGRGGMGVVYLARDTRLDRPVAVKALPATLASDPDRLARFEREARTLATLNHPNIAGIYGVEEEEGASYLLLEYVEGESLADRIDRGPIHVDDAIDLAAQIAQGVEAAHEAGVIHRDLKPGNVMVTPDGVAKVLDFGLARTEEPTGSSASIHENPTLTSPAQHSPTIPGVILGTAAYMSPEQARGRRVDTRTDIWSFGVLLYEMLTGASPFRGETVSDSIGAILHKDLDLKALPADTPRSVRRTLERCLARDRQARWRHIGDARIELSSRDSDPPALQPTTRSNWKISALVALIAAVAFAAAGFTVANRSRPEAPLVHASIEPPAGVRILFSGDLAGPPVISPDGLKVAFCGAREGELRRIWVRDLRDPEPRELKGTDEALFPFWSPDSREIGFFTTDSLKRFDLVSGTVQRVCDADQGRGASWTEDGRIIFSPTFRSGLSIVNAQGGEPQPLTEPDSDFHTSHRWPFAIPGTDQFLYVAVTSRVGETEHNGIYLGSIDDSQAPTRIMANDYGAQFVSDHLLYVRDGVLLASRLDLQSRKIVGPQTVVARDIAADLSTWHGQFSASASGGLVFNQWRQDPDDTEARRGYSWFAEGDRVSGMDSTGRVLATYAANTPMLSISLSPDGRLLAMAVISDDGFTDLWLHPTAFGTSAEIVDPNVIRSSIHAPEPRRLTFLDGAEISPVWSPDGTEIAFRWDGDGVRPRGIYRKRFGDGVETLVRSNNGGDDYPAHWTSDGRFLIIVSDTLIMSELNDIYAIPLDGGDEIPLVTGPGPDYWPEVSPDGRWLAYTSRSDARNQVYVIPFAPAWPEGQANRKWLVSENGGRMPRWSRDGAQLYYISDAGILIEHDIDASTETFNFSTPRALFQTPWDTGRTYAVSPKLEGMSQFAFLDSGEDHDAPISLLLNWQQALKTE